MVLSHWSSMGSPSQPQNGLAVGDEERRAEHVLGQGLVGQRLGAVLDGRFGDAEQQLLARCRAVGPARPPLPGRVGRGDAEDGERCEPRSRGTRRRASGHGLAKWNRVSPIGAGPSCATFASCRSTQTTNHRQTPPEPGQCRGCRRGLGCYNLSEPMPRPRSSGLRGQAGPLFQRTTRVPRSRRRRVRLVCAEQSREMQDFITAALRECLQSRQRR
jgi:hypothetical protein